MMSMATFRNVIAGKSSVLKLDDFIFKCDLMNLKGRK